MMIKLAKRVFLCANGVTSISGRINNLRWHFSQPAMAGTLPSYLGTTKLRSVMPRTVFHKAKSYTTMKSYRTIRNDGQK